LSAEDINVKEWLNRKWGGVERNYCWLLFTLTIFCARRWPDRNLHDYEEYKNIGIETWNQYIPNSEGQLTIIRNILEAAQVLQWNHRYLSKAAAAKTGKIPFSKSVRIFDSDQVHYRSITSKAISGFDTKPVFENSKWLNSNDDLPITGDHKTTEVIRDNIALIRIPDNALEVVEAFDFSKEDNPEESKSSNYRSVATVHSFAARGLKDSEREYWNISIRYHEHTGRVYHNYASFPRKFRHLLTIKGFPIRQVDAVAAHPFLLIKLYDEAEAPPQDVERERSFYNKRFSHNNDFYTTVGKFGNIPRASEGQGPDEYRSMVKGMFWEFVYGKPKHPSRCSFTRAYEQLFPILMRTINKMKTTWVVGQNSLVFQKIEESWKKESRKRATAGKEPIPVEDFQYKQLSYLMQRLEGEIMIKGVCHQLAHKGIEVDGKMVKPWFVPVHDAIWCQRYMVKPIKRLMKKMWFEKLGAKAAFTSKSLG